MDPLEIWPGVFTQREQVVHGRQPLMKHYPSMGLEVTLIAVPQGKRTYILYVLPTPSALHKARRGKGKLHLPAQTVVGWGEENDVDFCLLCDRASDIDGRGFEARERKERSGCIEG